MHSFKLILLVWLLFNCFLDKNAATKDECYYSNTKSSDKWKMVWQDEFESNQLGNWKIDHEQDNCEHVYTSQTNCHHQENAWTTNGLMVMMVKKEKYADRSFTGASITTKQFFNYGRIEIRAIVPIEEYIPVIFFTHNDNDHYWTETGHITIMNVHDSINDRGFYPFGSRLQADFIPNDLLLNRNVNNSFHRYGVEWDGLKMKFFFDDQYGESILLSNSFRVVPPQQLRIKIGAFKNADYVMDKINWNCPAFLVDYVRVYEKIPPDYNVNEFSSKLCADKSENELGEAERVVKKICSEASIGNRFKSPNMTSPDKEVKKQIQPNQPNQPDQTSQSNQPAQSTQPSQLTKPKQPTQSTEILAKPNSSWAYATIALLMIIIIILVVFIVYKFYAPRMVAKRTAGQDGFELMIS